jgi:hypothetical protein
MARRPSAASLFFILAASPLPWFNRAMQTGYGQFCPIAKASEVFAPRWTPLVLREFMANAHSFDEIHRGLPLSSRAVRPARPCRSRTTPRLGPVRRPARRSRREALKRDGQGRNRMRFPL